MIVTFLKNLTESYKWLPEMAGIIGLLLLIFKKGRGWIVGFIVGLYNWFLFPFKGQNLRREILSEIGSIKVELKKNTEISEKTAKDIIEVREIIGHNGGGGLLDMVGVLAGFQQSEFWLRPQPGFISDGDGRNIDITHAYSILLKLSSKADLTGISWKSYTDREKSGSYLNEFKEAALRRESFRGKIELFDINAESRGFWIVVAHPISAEKAKSKRYIGFLYPGDELSREIARSYNWPLVVPT